MESRIIMILQGLSDKIDNQESKKQQEFKQKIKELSTWLDKKHN